MHAAYSICRTLDDVTQKWSDMLHLLVWLPEQDTTQQPTIRQVKTANRHRRQHAPAQQNPTTNNRQKVNSDEGEVA